MASNEYKLTVVDGTELTLSVNAGLQGPSGPAGPAGPAGADALWNYTGDYSVGASYAVGDVATYGGETFYRTDAHGGNTGDTPFDGSLYWDLLVAKGADGPNEITTSTDTPLVGYIYGNGTNVAGSTTASTTASPNTLALRDANGKLAASDLEIYVKAATTIPKGAVVYISGASGNNKLISLAQATTDALSSKTIGVSIQAIADNAFGYVVTEGDITGLGISLGSGHGVVEGDPIWLSPTTAGGMVFKLANKPSAPNHMVFVGYVTKLNGNTLDSIYVKIQNGFEFEELHNVAISSPTNGQIVSYNGSTGLWSNAGITQNVTSTNIAGLLHGDGSKVGVMSVTPNPTPLYVAQRDIAGRINATQIRLYNDGSSPLYTQINPSATSTSNVSFQFPLASGTIATNNTAVMLTGDQLTINGDKTFKGQIQLDGQSLDDGNSALTRDLADARYGATFVGIKTESVSSSDETPIKLTSIVLPIGMYQIDSCIASYAQVQANTAGGHYYYLKSDYPIRLSLFEQYGNDNATTTNSVIATDSTQSSVRIIVTATTHKRQLMGLLEVLTNNTEVSLEFSQRVATPASPSVTRKRAYIIARKIA
jgi:hypothetical protein